MLRPPMPPKSSSSPRKPVKRSPAAKDAPKRFDRSDGRFDLPTVEGRSAKQIARRLA
jgi:hypothetical protein